MRIETRQLAGERVDKLWEVAPLPTPWTIFIDVTNRCNFRCVYCPTGNPDMIKHVERHTGHMPMDLYRKIVNDMRELDPRPRVVNLYKDGEPLFHPNFVEMVHVLYDAGVTDRIYTKTNGELITKNKGLASAPLDMLGISVPHSDPDKIPDVVGKKVNYQKYIDGIKALYEDSRRSFTINAKMAFYNMTDDDVEKFYHDFEPICDTVAIEGLHGWGANDLGDMLLGVEVEPHDGSPVVPHLACPLPLYMMSINSDGSTAVCCAEWGHFHDLGDVHKESVLDLWNNDKRNAFRLMHLEGRRNENMACKDCQYRDTLMDNIDDHLDEMIERMR
jgi:radical SAM protein with 4Fe4S-binding SPASM domain